MAKVRRISAFALAIVMVMTLAIIPAKAAGYVPTCAWCGNTNITPTGRVNQIPMEDGTYIEYEYKCYRCGGCTWIAKSLLN